MVTHSDIARALQEALEKAQAQNTEIDYSKGLSTWELAEHLGVSQGTARSLVRKAIGDGTIVFAGRAYRPNITGNRSSTPVYLPRSEPPEG
jgi:DNA-binding transcriptional regulator LsrR (DeoR family)